MKTIDDIFSLIKQTVNLTGNVYDYKIKLSTGRFERDNLIGVFRIREGIASNQGNKELALQMNALLAGLEETSEIQLKGVTIHGKNYFGVYYFSEDYKSIIGYIGGQIDNIEKNINE